jgi:RHS repeat-associated protein
MIWRVILFWLIGMSFVRADLPRHPSVAAVAFCNSPYVYDGPLVIHERDTNNNPQVTYTRGLDLSLSLRGAGGIGGLLARTDSNGPACYHSDGSGNITALIDADQYIAARYEYDPYGKLIGKWGRLADANRYRFSSKEYQPASGLYYYGYRFYEPNFGRWLNHDPLGEVGGVNLYGFVGNNPVNRIDPFGLSWLVSGTPFAPGQQGTYGPYAYYLNDGRNDIIPANEYPTEDMFYGGLQSADGDFLLLSGLADGLAAAGKFGLDLAESGIKAAGKCFAKEAPQAAKPAWSKPLTKAQSQKLADAMAKSLDEKLKTGGFNAAMYEIMIENGATPAEAYAATFGRLKP